MSEYENVLSNADGYSANLLHFTKYFVNTIPITLFLFLISRTFPNWQSEREKCDYSPAKNPIPIIEWIKHSFYNKVQNFTNNVLRPVIFCDLTDVWKVAEKIKIDASERTDRSFTALFEFIIRYFSLIGELEIYRAYFQNVFWSRPPAFFRSQIFIKARQ